ncbi:hypothetical protein AQUCO_03700094v1 [Aquilegia coerulea]|uniref:Uncharacterized protein n=1 Tax=Aquilegia coerulea TaxID=218851 RepID=A0A2G5CUJ3_AQUCA|nr:hypothetical protein AQUCO_03700094v1 [Aquilegia coerulea]
MKKIVVLMVILFLFSSHIETVKPDAADCYDGCSTACVQRDTRKMQRCDIKCSIRCAPPVFQLLCLSEERLLNSMAGSNSKPIFPVEIYAKGTIESMI